MTEHEYMTTIEWTGTTAGGYRSFSREHAATLTANAAERELLLARMRDAADA